MAYIGVYRGQLRDVLHPQGGDIRPFLLGKIAMRHILIVNELTYQEVLLLPPVLSAYLGKPEGRKRLLAMSRGEKG